MRTAFIALLVPGTPRVALACPVCFGQSDSPMAAATNIAIVFMLIVVVVVLAAFASFFVYLMRRARMAAEDSGAHGPDPADAARYVRDAQEETA